MVEQLKNLYSKDFIEKLVNRISLTYPDFQKENFINSIFDIFPSLNIYAIYLILSNGIFCFHFFTNFLKKF